MLGRPVSDQVWEALHNERPYDREQHLAGLRALPGSWERERTTTVRQRSGATTTPARRLAGQREQPDSATAGPASTQRPPNLRTRAVPVGR